MGETLKLFGILLLIFIVVGSILQTIKAFPNLLNKEFDVFASKTTILLILIVICFGLFMYFLQLRAREGFQDGAQQTTVDLLQRWKTLSSNLKLADVCKLFNEMETQMVAYEKGAPPDELTEQQAKERVEAIFQKESPSGVFSCVKFQAIQDANDIDTLFVKIQEVPDSFLLQALDTAKACRKLLREQLIKVEKSLNKDVTELTYILEPFVDRSVGICSADIVEERRKFLREKKLSEAQQACLLPEEVPLESKEEIVSKKMDTLLRGVDRTEMEKLPAILQQANEFKKKLESYKTQAEEGTLRPEGTLSVTIED